MAIKLCIPQEKINEIRKALKNRELDVFRLMKMTSEERTALFEKFAGKEAKTINLLFEQKLILKNKLQGLKNWAAKIAEIGRYDPAKKAELEKLAKEFELKQRERLFNPKEEESFLADLVEAKLGTRISREEAKTIFNLSLKVDEAFKKYDEKAWEDPKNPDRLAYGAAKVAYENFVEKLKNPEYKFKDAVKAWLQETGQKWQEDKFKIVKDVLNQVIKGINNNTIALVASLDNSFIGRQGLKVLFTHPTKWWVGAKQSFVDLAKTIGGKNMKDALMAELYSDPDFINGTYQKAGLIPKYEEQFPTSLPEKIPVLGRFFKASEIAFEGSAIRMRTGVFKLLKNIAQKNGVEIDDVWIKDVGKLVNSLTARGKGKITESEATRFVLWAPRMIKANLDVLTAHYGGLGLETAFARKQAAYNLAKIVLTTAGIMAIANAIKPGSAETDPTSSDFGKIKVGNTRFDFTGGAGSLVVLGARLITQSYKSSTTGIKTKLGSKIGQRSSFDIIIDFLTGKTTPVARTIIDIARGQNFEGKKPTLANSVFGLITPISIQNAFQLKDDHSVAAIMGVLLDAVGLNSNTYLPREVDWLQSDGVEILAFRKKIGDNKFKEANDLYNQKYNEWLQKVLQNPRFLSLSDEDKQKIITNKKTEIKEWVFKKYGFYYKPPRKSLPKF